MRKRQLIILRSIWAVNNNEIKKPLQRDYDLYALSASFH